MENKIKTTKTIRVSGAIAEDLETVKESLGLKTLGQAADMLFKVSNSPMSVFAFLLEARENAKEILQELRTLNENLENVTKILSSLASKNSNSED